MNIMKIWLRAQLFNLLLGLLVAIGLLVISIQNDRQLEDSIALMSVIYFVYVIICFVGGLPLLLFMQLGETLFEKISPPVFRWTYYYVVFGAETFFYASILLWLLFFRENGTISIQNLEIFLVAIPSVVAMLLSVSYEQFYSNKQIQDDPSDSIAN